MKRTASLLPVLVIALAFFALPAHAQWDTGSDPKMGVENVQYMSTGCTMAMTADQCFAAGTGFAGGMKTCTASECARCGNNFLTGKAECFTAKGINGSCECTVETTYDAAGSRWVTTCTGKGQCTYAP